MKRLFTLALFILSLITVSGQTPQKINYQAVIRDAVNNPVIKQTIGIKASIIQSSLDGPIIYSETWAIETNGSGLAHIKIGEGTTTYVFTDIDWSGGPYYLKTEIDLNGGTDYTISGTSQILSVPYALHAKTAEKCINPKEETDPVFTSWDKSTGISITVSQITDFGNYIETETDPVFEASVASGITADDTTYWNNKLDGFSETDPVYSASQAVNITEDNITNLGNLSGVNTGDQDISGIDVNTQAIQDSASQIRADIPDVSGFIITESDPVFDASLASDITESDTSNWNNKLDSYTETDPVYIESVAGGITITDTSNWNNKQENLTAGTGISIVGNTISATSESSGTHYVGELFGGGVVYWVDQTGQHGLVISMINVGIGDWSNVTSELAGASSYFDGANNTLTIINQSGHTNSAAKLCNDYINEDYGTGVYNDWYLPSIGELKYIRDSYFEVREALDNDGNSATKIDRLLDSFYWSSSEATETGAWKYGFDALFQGRFFTIESKTSGEDYVRAVRAF